MSSVLRRLAVLAFCAAFLPGLAKAQSGDFEDLSQHSVLKVPANAAYPLAKRVAIGLSKSILIQFPFELKDVLVADPEKVDAVVQASNRVFLIAKKLGQTNAFFFDTKGQQILTLEISVGADLKGLDGILKKFIPGSNVKVDMAGSSAVLSGSVRTPVDAKRAADIACQFVASNKSGLAATSTPTATGQQSGPTACGGDSKLVINMLTIEGEEQVTLKVTVAEVQRSVLKQMGVNIGSVITSGNFSTSLLTANTLPITAGVLGTIPTAGIGTTSTSGTTGCALAGTLCNYNAGPTSSTYGNSGISGSYTAGNVQVSQALKAMEREGLIRTLAEPNLTAVSGETAKFLAGGEYPIPMVDNTGKVSVTFKEFGVVVAFTPVVMSEGRISLRIASEVSELSDDGAITLSGYNIKALKKRQANSVVELPSGGSLAIAGLISDTTRQNMEGLPGVKDMPILGTLFRSRDYSRNETELVMIVTPYIVRPTSPRALATPDRGLAPASDLKANFLGHLNRVYGPREAPRNGGLKGDYGFIID
ncbi:MAG: type II and III secretion system protein family protein [Hyphomicrobiaceae bacterium]|nr:type II and III secretion system protein family protein [Hyphomicrobiaceae bacterium]